ncbi:MAG: hypothetical protein Q9187_007905, partial [Circinaria calcarea]
TPSDGSRQRRRGALASGSGPKGGRKEIVNFASSLAATDDGRHSDMRLKGWLCWVDWAIRPSYFGASSMDGELKSDLSHSALSQIPAQDQTKGRKHKRPPVDLASAEANTVN